ncbi:MAG: FAD:protein FMN transferase [Eubacterium sp.]|nr:FAD:protein FMN transferase [Eubacterium sp.]
MQRKLHGIRVVSILLIAIMLSGCASPLGETGKKQYRATFLDVFDTVTTIVGMAEDEETFRTQAQKMYDELMEYHQLFDIYNEYDGITNLKNINDCAGEEPVKVDERIIELLLDCQEFYEQTNGKVNVAMGSVLSLWHEARTEGLNDPLNAKLPDEKALAEAARHTDIEQMIIDIEASTVFLADAEMRLDVGAIAKGWAAQKVADNCDSGYMLSVGGNVCATGPKDEKDTPWVVGIENPDTSEESYLHTVYLTKGCVVTSGDYQRNYVVDGQLYHHIIDPDTLYPSKYWRAVSIVCQDSGVADALSTALFLMNQEEGQKLLEHYGAVAMWVDADGTKLYSPGFQDIIRT